MSRPSAAPVNRKVDDYVRSCMEKIVVMVVRHRCCHSFSPDPAVAVSASVGSFGPPPAALSSSVPAGGPPFGAVRPPLHSSAVPSLAPPAGQPLAAHAQRASSPPSAAAAAASTAPAVLEDASFNLVAAADPEIRAEVAGLLSDLHLPLLVALRYGTDAASAVYLEQWSVRYEPVSAADQRDVGDLSVVFRHLVLLVRSVAQTLALMPTSALVHSVSAGSCCGAAAARDPRFFYEVRVDRGQSFVGGSATKAVALQDVATPYGRLRISVVAALRPREVVAASVAASAHGTSAATRGGGDEAGAFFGSAIVADYEQSVPVEVPAATRTNSRGRVGRGAKRAGLRSSAYYDNDDDDGDDNPFHVAPRAQTYTEGAYFGPTVTGSSPQPAAEPSAPMTWIPHSEMDRARVVVQSPVQSIPSQFQMLGSLEPAHASPASSTAAMSASSPVSSTMASLSSSATVDPDVKLLISLARERHVLKSPAVSAGGAAAAAPVPVAVPAPAGPPRPPTSARVGISVLSASDVRQHFDVLAARLPARLQLLLQNFDVRTVS